MQHVYLFFFFLFFVFLMVRRPPRSTLDRSSAASDVYKRQRESAVATTANEALFLRRFLAYAEQQRLEYFVMEAFDQPWKTAAEGKVGAYWGCLLYTSPSPRDRTRFRMPSSA